VPRSRSPADEDRRFYCSDMSTRASIKLQISRVQAPSRGNRYLACRSTLLILIRDEARSGSQNGRAEGAKSEERLAHPSLESSNEAKRANRAFASRNIDENNDDDKGGSAVGNDRVMLALLLLSRRNNSCGLMNIHRVPRIIDKSRGFAVLSDRREEDPTTLKHSILSHGRIIVYPIIQSHFPSHSLNGYRNRVCILGAINALLKAECAFNTIAAMNGSAASAASAIKTARSPSRFRKRVS